jgi:hypothetical protein
MSKPDWLSKAKLKLSRKKDDSQTTQGSSSRDQDRLQTAVTVAKFVVTVAAEVTDACPALKSIAAGLRIILEHAAVSQLVTFST